VEQFRIRFALAGALIIGVVAVATTLWIASAEDGLPVAELLRVEPLEKDGSPVTDHLRWTFELISGQREFTNEDLSERFEPAFASALDVDSLNAGIDAGFDEVGPATFVRYADHGPTFARAIGVVESGFPLLVLAEVAPGGRLVGWGIFDWPSPPRLPNWESAMVLVAGLLFIGVGLAMWRPRPRRRPWVELIGAGALLSTVLVLSSSSWAYTVGRVLPAAAVLVGAWLLLRPSPHPLRVWAIGAAAAAAGGAVVAPFTRDAAVIGHPSVLGSIADSSGLYRLLLAASAGLTALSMLLVVVVVVGRLRRASGWLHAPIWLGVATAAVWTAAATGSAIDYSFGEGVWAGGPLRAATLGSLGLVPVVLGLRLVVSRWDRPELAGLVVDLGAAPGGLQPAVAKALEDPSVRVLASLDGEQLLDEDGSAVAGDALPLGRSLTRIRSGERLIGGLVHDSALVQDPARLSAVVAAVGLALDVNRLNEEVTAQLEEVRASRTRIIEAGDAARKRIERDLHDGAQQRLVALGMDLQRAKRHAESKGEGELAAMLDSATSDVRRAIEEIRSVSRGSHPSLLAERGLGAAIEALAELSPIPVRTEVISDGLSAALEKTAYYVVAEGLTNVAKHAAASEAAVSIRLEDGSLRVVVADDGVGGASLAPNSGLQGLEDRVVATGGSLSIRSGVEGTTLTAVIPCE
jgi:signal transduction histidine kinase